MLESLEKLKAALKDLPQENLQALLAEVTASGQGAVAIARDATGAKIVTGSDNILGDNNRVVIHQGMDAEILKLVLQEVLAAQSAYFYGLPETQPQIQAIAQAIREEITKSIPSQPAEVASVDELVQQVRSRIHNDIQRLHSTMPLWGVDHWVPLGELFVDVNILEEVSSNRRSELADLWQDFSQNPSYRGLDRMGLGKERQRVSGLEVLDRDTNLMVVGKPGSGKTTYLQRVVTECNAGNLQAHRIPALIRLREFVDNGRGVDYAVERYLERCWRLSAVEVQSVLDAGRSLVLLDGLDEVTGADGQTIAKQIKRFARAYPHVQVIVTCRTQIQESRFERFDSVEVADFNELQVRTFAAHWFQTVCEELTVGQTKAKAFLDQLFQEGNKPIRELAITPILLSLTCAVFQQKQTFYSKRSKLYEEGLELLLEQWDKSREIYRDEIYRDLSVERKLELLSYLAVKKFEQEQYVLFEQAELEGYIAEFLGIGVRESRGVLKAIEAQHGLLIERSQKVWSFSHLTLQEYLVARELVYKCSSFSSTEEYLSKIMVFIMSEHWREVFLLLTDLLDDEAYCLLGLMKTEIDYSVSSHEKLQEFLEWVHRKACGETLIDYYCNGLSDHKKPSAIRAFYANFDDFSYGSKFHISISALGLETLQVKHHLNSSYCFPHNQILTRDLNLRLILEKNYLPGLWNVIKCLLDKKAKDNLTLHEKDLLENLKPLAQELPQFSDYPDDYIYEKFVREEVDKKAEEFRAEIFDPWWVSQGNLWLEKLRAVSIKYCDLGYDWKFDHDQKILLKNYYDANSLLIICLINSKIDEEAKNSIEKTLFLPIAEIEKCQRERV